MNYFLFSCLFVIFLLSMTTTQSDAIAESAIDEVSISLSKKMYENRMKGKKLARYCWDMFCDVAGSAVATSGLYKSANRPNSQELNEELLDIELQLGDIKRSVNELISKVKEESIYTQYVSSERVITESLRCENNYNSMTETQSMSYWRREFLKWGSMLRESVNFIMDGILGKGMIGSDILQITAEIVNSGGGNKTARFESATDQLYGLVNAGFVVHATFVGLNNISTIANAPVVDLFDASYYNMSKRINDTLKTCGGSNGCTLPTSVYRAADEDEGQSIATRLTSSRRKRQLGTAIVITGIVNNMLSGANSVYRYCTKPNTVELMSQLKSIENQLDEVQAGLDQLMAEIADASMRTQYVSSQRIIMESFRIAFNYVNVSNEIDVTVDDLDYWASEMSKWGSLVRESVFFLMDGFLGNNVLAGDLLKYLVEAEQHDATAIERRFNETMALVNVGIIVHGLFVNFTDIPEAANAPVFEEFDASYTNISRRFQQTISNQEDRGIIESKMEEILRNKSLSADAKADSINLYLTTEVAPDRNWYLVVFYLDGKLDGNVEATQYFDDDFYWVKNVGDGANKMNAAAISYPTKMNTQKVQVDSAVSTAVNNFQCSKKKYDAAKQPTNEMHGSLDSTCPTCRIGTLMEDWWTGWCVNDNCHDQGHSYTITYPRIGDLLSDAVVTRRYCGELLNEGSIYHKYYSYQLDVLPPLPPRFTVPEEEY